MGKSKTMKKRSHSSRKKRVFTRKHFESKDGMVTGVWGPGAWHFIHTVSFNYPVHPTKEDKSTHKTIITSDCGKMRSYG